MNSIRSFNFLLYRFSALAVFLFVALSMLNASDISYVKIMSGFKKPLYVTGHVTNPDILYVLEQRGIIWSLNNGVREEKPF